MSGAPVIVFAFDPIDELGDAHGLLVLSAELAGRLIAEHRAEATAPHIASPMRFVVGSAAHDAAREALRAAREADAARSVRAARKLARLVER
jgi:hypothetical protein